MVVVFLGKDFVRVWKEEAIFLTHEKERGGRQDLEYAHAGAVESGENTRAARAPSSLMFHNLRHSFQFPLRIKLDLQFGRPLCLELPELC